MQKLDFTVYEEGSYGKVAFGKYHSCASTTKSFISDVVNETNKKNMLFCERNSAVVHNLTIEKVLFHCIP